MKIRILTDTGADLTAEDIKKYNIEVIPMNVYFSSNNDDDFWKNIISGKMAKTSQPSPELFKNAFLDAKEHNETIIYIAIASYLSSTYESAVNIKNQIGYENIYIVDALNASLSQRLLVLKACELIKEKSPQEVVNYLNEFKHKIKLYACIDSLKHLANGGRISKMVASIGSLINIKPIISLDSEGLKVINKAIGNTRAIIKLIDLIKKQSLDETYQIYPMYSCEPTNGNNMVNKMEKVGLNLAHILPIGSTIGSHIGPFGFGISFIIK